MHIVDLKMWIRDRRKASDLENHIDGLILPGGESTVQGKLLRELGMYDILKEKIENGLPVLATCAGMILLASQIDNDTTRDVYKRQSLNSSIILFCSIFSLMFVTLMVSLSTVSII